MKKHLLFLFLFCTLGAYAQKEANIWYFGENAGVDFTSGTPVALTNSALNTPEGCATISDANGNLLFYTDGIKVWNRTHTQMPNGFGLLGDPSSAQSAVAVPKPGNKDKYYLFTVAAQGNAGGFCYTEIDMALNGGLGDVVSATKNTQLFTPSVEKITATRHSNGLYVWVIAHGFNNNTYYAYLVDCNGVAAPVTTNVGQVEGWPGWGYLTSSPDGKRLATAMRGVGFELLDFNNTTGVISNPVLLSNPGEAYGVSFSPNSSVLYGLQINTGNIFQWNLLAGSSAAIIASNTTIGVGRGMVRPGTNYRGGALQLGPDNKLYVVQWYQAYLTAINSPNTVGLGCNIQYNAVDLLGRNGVLGLPGFIQSFFDTPVTITHVNHCDGESILFSINSNTSSLDSVRWNFGDPATAATNTSNSVNPGHVFSTPGTYSVRLIKYLKCIADTAYKTVVVDTMPKVDLGPDVAICADSVTLQSSITNGTPTYLWNTGATTVSIDAKIGGKYWLQVTQSGCSNTDTIDVDLQARLSVDLGADRAVCENTLPVTLKPNLPSGTQYLWNTGLTNDSINVIQAGTYWLHATRIGCDGSDTVKIGTVTPPVINIGNDSVICAATPMEIGAFVAEAVYSWNSGETTPYINVDKTNDYILTVTLGPCVVKDTVAVTAMPNPPLDLGIDTDICPKQVIVLNAGSDGSVYLWNDGSTNATYTVTQAGTYWVKVISPYKCVSNDTVHYKYYALPTVLLPGDTTVCERTPLLLSPVFVINEDSLRWWPLNAVAGQLSVTKGDVYIVEAINKCGSVYDTVDIRQVYCDVWVPNAFTPNGDGKNDILRIVGNIGRMEDFELSIFNRWGQMVFRTNDKHQGWDGMYKGEPSAIDTYLYMFQYSFEGKSFIEKGDVTLIR